MEWLIGAILYFFSVLQSKPIVYEAPIVEEIPVVEETAVIEEKVALVVVEEATTTETIAVATSTEEKPKSTEYCSCVSYLKRFGIYLGLDAKDIKPNTTFFDARPGDLLLLKYPQGIYHISYIHKISNKGIHVSEANFRKCQRTERIIAYIDPAIIGFHNPVDNKLSLK